MVRNADQLPGGIVKRGLFGEVAFFLEPLIPAKRFVVATLFVCYLVFIAFLFFWLALPKSFAGLMYVFSPVGVMFPIYVSDAFGRKDAFILVALAASVVAIKTIPKPHVSLPVLFCIYVAISFSIEIVWFYFTLVFALFLWCHRSEQMKELMVYSTLAAVVMGLFLIFNYKIGQNADVSQLASSWKERYPDVSTAALCCVKYTFGQALSGGQSQLVDPVRRNGYITGFLLGCIPFALLALERTPSLTSANWLVVLALISGLAVAMVPFVFAADWGRYIYLLLAHATTVVASAPRTISFEARKRISAARIAQLAMLLVLYSASWTLLHYEKPGHSPLNVGPLFWPSLGKPVPYYKVLNPDA